MTWHALRSTTRWTAGLGIPALFLTIAWRHTDPRAGASLLAGVGPLLPLALLPYAGVLAIDALGWRLLMPGDARSRVRLRDAFTARLAGDAVAQTAPWAGLAGEAASAWLLARRSGVLMGRTIGGLVVRRLLLAPGHGIVLVAAALAALVQPSLPLPLAAAIGGTAMLLLFASAAGSKLLIHGTPFSRLQAVLRRRPWAGLTQWTREPAVRLSEADHEAARLLAGPWQRRAAAAACFTLVFVAEAGETLFLLRLLGTRVTPAQVLVIEPVVSLVRAVAVFAPAGLGVQDLGYVSLLQLLGVPNAAAAGAAFVLLKRLKELVWTTAGWSLLLAADARRAPALQHGWVQVGPRREEVGGEPGAAEDLVHLRDAEPDDADAPGRSRTVGA